MNTLLTPFKKVMTDCGAVYSDESTETPSHFGSPELEESTAQQNTVLFEFSNHKLLEFTGNDRTQFLHNFCTNDISGLSSGNWCEAFIPDIKSHALGHGLIFAEENSLWMEMAPHSTEALLPHFNKFSFLDDVTIEDQSQKWGLLFLSGPNAAQFLNTHLSNKDKLPELNEFQTIKITNVECKLARIDRLGQPGYLLKMLLSQLVDVWQQFVNAGIQPAGSEAYNALRIAAGYPLYGLDISEKELVQEVNRSAAAISFTKGCYLGQEPIARIDSLGHVNRLLCSFQLASKTGKLDSPVIYSETDDTEESTEIGAITSVAYSYLNKCQIAIGYVKTKSLSSKNPMFVLIGSQKTPVTK
ncbi:tRNA-modifying protein YgfZ, partial [hydrothermal vent metagenome]